MLVDLREIPIFVINTPEQTLRRRRITEDLARYGLEARFVSGIRCRPGAVGCALSHLKTLTHAAPEPPFLVLEDDCEFVPDRFRHVWALPDDADALYLGHSRYGLRDEPDQWGHRWSEHGNVKYAVEDGEYVRVLNMLARHAILYLSRGFVRAAIEAGRRALIGYEFPVPGDLEYAEMQAQLRVLTTREPICFQVTEDGRPVAVTYRSILS